MPKVLKQHDRYWGPIAIYGDYLPWNVHKAAGGEMSDDPRQWVDGVPDPHLRKPRF
jgi:hypothetical protein